MSIKRCIPTGVAFNGPDAVWRKDQVHRCEGFGELHIWYVGGLCAFFIKRGLNRTQVFPTQRSSFIDRSILERIGQWPDSDASPALLRGGGQSTSFTDTKYSSFVKAPGRRPIPGLFVSVMVDCYAKSYKNWPYRDREFLAFVAVLYIHVHIRRRVARI